MRPSELGRYGATAQHLIMAAEIIENAADDFVRAWLSEAVQALQEGGWTSEDFGRGELEDEARRLLARTAYRLRHDLHAPQTSEERSTFRLLGGPDLLDSDRDVKLVSLFRVQALVVNALTIALLDGVPEDWSAATLLEVRAKTLTASGLAAGFRTPCQFVEMVEERLRQRQAETADVFRRMLTAQEDERRRLSRDVHDVLAQSLANCMYRAETSAMIVANEPEASADEMRSVAALIGQTLHQVRDIIFDLRPRTLDGGGLGEAVDAYIARMTRPGDRIRFEVVETGDTSDLDDTLKTALYRILQEAVSNVLRHSTARRATINIERDVQAVHVAVDDSGRGFDVDSISELGGDGHVGLASMRERCQLLGGHFEIASQPGSGTRLRLSVPLHP